MSQAFRISIGTIILAPLLAAFVLTGFPADAATVEQTASLRDPRVSIRIDRSVKDSCRHEAPGSVEYSICLAEGRKNAYRAAADARRGDKQDANFSLR